MLLSFFLYYLFISSVYRLFLYGSCNTVFYVLRAVTSVCSQDIKSNGKQENTREFRKQKAFAALPSQQEKAAEETFYISTAALFSLYYFIAFPMQIHSHLQFYAELYATHTPIPLDCQHILP